MARVVMVSFSSSVLRQGLGWRLGWALAACLCVWGLLGWALA